MVTTFPVNVPDTLILQALFELHAKELAPYIKAEQKDRDARTIKANENAKVANVGATEKIRMLEARIKELEEGS